MHKLKEGLKAAVFALLGILTSPAVLGSAIDSAVPEVLPSKPCSVVHDRPCVALVLGGGGAKGGAHIGVLKALEDQRIPIDLIVGTSIGSFVGGLYASGLDAKTIETLFANANWNAGYRDALSRSDIPMRRKRQLDQFQIHLDLGVSTAGVSLPKGFIQGQSMKTLLDNMLGIYPNFVSFDELPIPFRAVAADAETGEQVVLSQGDFATAMQASMTLPGIVRPIELDGRVLVDGGIANNIPVSVAKDLGADIVIAVDIGASAFDKDSLQSGLSILLQLTRFLTQINVTEQKALLTEQDLLVVPDLGDIGLLSFDRVDEAVELGYLATQKRLEKSALTSMSGHNVESLPRLSGEAHKRVVSEKRYESEIVVDEIALNNRTRLGDEYLLNRMDIHQGDVVTQEALVEGESRLYGQGTIARIRASWDKSEDKNILNVDVEEKEWGPGYLDLMFAFEDDFSSFSEYQLGGSYRLTNLSPYGAEWHSTFIFGTEKILSTELYWPIRSSGFFWNLYADYQHEVYEYREGKRTFGSAQITTRSVIGSVGWNTWDKFELSIGVLREYVVAEIPSYLSDILPIGELEVDQMGGVIGVNFDSLNDASFPSRGWKLKAELSRTRNDFLSTSNYSTQIDGEINGVLSFEAHSVRNLLRYQSHLKDDTFSLLGNFELGGFLNLSGIPRDTIAGSHVRFLSSVYTYQLAENDFGAIDFPLYIGASIEAGNAWSTEDEVDYGDLIKSGSVFLGWDTPIGPFYLAYGLSSTSDKSLYAFLGVTF